MIGFFYLLGVSLLPIVLWGVSSLVDARKTGQLKDVTEKMFFTMKVARERLTLIRGGKR